MKIIKSGNPRSPTRYRCTCPSCGCEFETELSEIDIGLNHQQKTLDEFFRCPQDGCRACVLLNGCRMIATGVDK